MKLVIQNKNGLSFQRRRAKMVKTKMLNPVTILYPKVEVDVPVVVVAANDVKWLVEQVKFTAVGADVVLTPTVDQVDVVVFQNLHSFLVPAVALFVVGMVKVMASVEFVTATVD
jgi:hypothetical protein